MEDKLKQIHERFRKIEEDMSRPEIISDQNQFRALTKEHSALTPVMQEFEEYKKLKKELEDSKELIEEEKDEEMKEMLRVEIEELESQVEECSEKLVIMLLPKDPNSGKEVIMEIRAGTGGDEAGIFAADLFRMYTRYADKKGWKFEIFDDSKTEVGGYKQVSISFKSEEAWDKLKFESGVHRVQRIPETESGGRIHTSSVSVVVLPEAEEDEIEIDPADLRIDFYRSSGHGGQSVNTTDSAVRITHVPTGEVSTCQDEKSQHKNKAQALRVLRARLLEKASKERMAKDSELRKSQIGSGDRSEKIRTYNYPQSRVTDHRINLSLYSLEAVMTGEIEEIIEAMQKYSVEKQLKGMGK
ncbi:MAG: peptide chain release factor 1 [bacterium]|nr:peptide chain release factor 1 [bacterium]